MSRTLQVTYCDDIRHELGNKRSFIGIYGPLLILNELPATLTKLCIAATLSTPVETPFGSIRLVVKRGGDVIADYEVPHADIEQGQARIPATIPADALDPKISYDFELVFAPLLLEGATKLSISAFTEAGEVRGKALLVRSGASSAVAAGAPEVGAAPTKQRPPKRKAKSRN